MSMKTVRDLLNKLRQSKGGRLQSPRPHPYFPASNPGDASSHSTKNLPVLLAGDGFLHSQHLHFDPQNPPPLCNLYVSMLQRLGTETGHFGTSSGTLPGLSMV
jgi:hypothetical protein